MPVDLLSLLPTSSRLALAYSPAAARPQTLALFALDARLESFIRARGEPIGAQLRLAWWRDRLGEAPSSWPGGEPVLGGLEAWRDPGLLVPLVDGWEILLSETLEPDVVHAFADGRGQACVALAEELSSDRTEDAALAGRLWALADLASNLSDPAEKALVLGVGRQSRLPRSLPRALRPLAVLAALGARSIRRGGVPMVTGPGSALTALRAGLFGR